MRAEDAPAQVGLRDWPMWGGTIHRNLASLVAKNIPDTWDTKKGKEKNIKWTARLGTMAYGGPVVAGGKVFVGTNNGKPRDPKIRGDKGVLLCFRESDGQFLWQIVHDKLPNPDENDFPNQGVLSAPVVEGNCLYYVSNRCELVCADTEGDPTTGKGKIVWKLDMIKELGVYPCYASNSSPLIVGDLVFAVTSNGVFPNKNDIPSPKAPSFVAVDKHTGKVVWTDNSPGDKIMDGQWSSPVAAQVNGRMLVIYAGGDGWLYAFEAKSGKLVWKFDCNPKGTKFQLTRGDKSYIIATPVVYDNKLYVAVGLQPDFCHGAGHLWCVDITKEPKNKDKDISPVNNNFDPKAPVNKDSGLVWHHGGPVVPKPEGEGREVIFARTISTVAIHDGLVYAAEMDGFLQCLDARTGKKYWEYDLKDSTWCSPFYVDGKVFLGTKGGDMFVFRPGKELKEPGKISMDHPLEVPPVAVNGVLFVNTGSNLYAIASK
jgi:outer membrane protein assembly factor BamB